MTHRVPAAHTTSPTTATRLARTLATWCVSVITIIVALALGTEVSGAQQVAATEQTLNASEIHDIQQAREFAVEMLGTNFASSRAAAEAALRGGEVELEAYSNGGLLEARVQDLRQIAVTISAVSGPAVQAAAKKAIGAGDEQSLATFIDSGWPQAQQVDDRDITWRASQAPAGTSLKGAADKALQTNTADALSDFATTGQDAAKAHDRRREVYNLTRSTSPAVARGAQEAIQVGTDTAIESYLRYGQFVAAAQDAEKMSIEELVGSAVSEADKARNAASLAAQNADQAKRATEAARQATERSKAEAQAADAAQVRAGNAAAQAGKLANQSALAADNAVAAAADARTALQQTADALSRAASAASRARIAAQEASARASAAGMDASQARQARIAAENARNAAAAADKAAQSFVHADAAWGYAQSAGSAASSAAGNADAAAAAASDAAAAAGDGDAAAADARAGAARAREAAGRARAAANEVDGLVVRIKSLVQQARQAAKEAAEHARRSAKAAEDAAAEADKAITSAQKAGVNAQDAQVAANKAVEAVNLAFEISKLARDAADQRLAQEAAYLKDQADQSRAAQDAVDAAQNQERTRRDQLTADMRALGANTLVDGDGTDNPTTNFSGDMGQLRQSIIAAATVGGPAVSGAAKTALASGSDADLRQFATDGYRSAASMDERAQLDQWWTTDPNEDVRFDSGYYANAAEDVVHWFATDGVEDIRKPALVQQVWQIRGSGGASVQAAADAALQADTFDALDGFINGGGFDKARYEDQLRFAYDLTRTGTPEVKAAAEAAVRGDRAGLNEFVTIESSRRAAADAQRATHDGYINGLLQKGFSAAQSAAQSAAKAQQSYFAARGDAVKANQYATEAASWAGKAQVSAQQAGEHVRSAEGSLRFAQEQQQRAHAAADQAEADAAQATSNADQAESYAADARQSASQAASSAASARASADAAGQDANLAAQAANDAYKSAWDKWHAEQAEIQADQDRSAEAGQPSDSPQGMLDIIKGQIGKEALDLVLEIIGVTDVLNCMKGQISGCLMAAVGLIPWTKLGKVALAMPAIRKLAGKTGSILEAFKKRSGALANKLDNARNTPACPVNFGASYSAQKPVFTFGVHRTDYAGSEPRFSNVVSLKCSIRSTPTIPFRGGNYYRLGTGTLLPLGGKRLQRHHILSSEVIKSNPNHIPAGMKRNNAPAIQMTPADHQLTLSWGNSGRAIAYRAKQAELVRQGRIDDVFQLEVDFIQETFGAKYDYALKEMLKDAQDRGFISKAVQA